MRYHVLIIASFMTLTGCTYAVSRQAAARADRGVTFERLAEAPEAFKGRVVIAGGAIVQARRVRQGSLIEVIQRDLDYWGRPLRTMKSGGRFYILILDAALPDVYAAGMDITVAGEVINPEPGMNDVSGHPLLRAEEVRVWQTGHPSDRPAWWDPLYDPSGPERHTW